MAARRDPEGVYAVAGTYRMPVLPERVDVLLTHFSPVSAADFRRVGEAGRSRSRKRSRGGTSVQLQGTALRQACAARPETTLANENGFELIDTSVIRYPLSLRGPGQVANLLLMTPFFWSVDDDTRARLVALTALDTEVDVVVHAYRRTGGAPAGVE